MMKFELARKYLVGFLALAVLTMSLTLPLSAPVAAADLNATPILNGTPTVGLSYSPTSPLSTKNDCPTRSMTANVQAITKDGGGGLSNTGTVVFSLRTSTGTVLLEKTVSSTTPTGYWNTTFNWTEASSGGAVAGTHYFFYAMWEYNGILTYWSDPVEVWWETPVAKTIYIEPATKTNTVSWTGTTPVGSHTVTITVKDQFGCPLDDVTVNVGVTGVSPTTGVTTTDTDGEAVFSYDFLSTATPISQGLYGDDAITATASGTSTSTTAAKTWRYAPKPWYDSITPTEATNVVGDTHTVTVAWFDQYHYALSWHFTIDWSVDRSSTASPNQATHTGTAVSDSFTYTNTLVGKDTITASTFLDGELTSVPLTATKFWTVDTGYILTLSPSTATNTVGNTHTVTALLTDKYGNVVTNTTVEFSVNPTTRVDPTTGTDTTDVGGFAHFSFTSTLNQSTIITASAVGTTTTAVKIWQAGPLDGKHSGFPGPDGTPVQNISWYNMVDANHTATVLLQDKYGNPPFPLPTYVGYTITGVNPDTDTVPVDANGQALIHWNSTLPGVDVLTVTVPGQNGDGTFTGTKYWSLPYNVGPFEEINSIGSEHQFVVQGAPYGRFTWNIFEGTGEGRIQIRSYEPAGQVTINQPYGAIIPTGHEATFSGSAVLDATGSATFTVYSKLPFKYYFEVDFGLDNYPLYTARAYNRGATPTLHWEVAKIYAVILDSVLSPVTATNCIKGNTALDQHTLTTTVFGLYRWYGGWSDPVAIGHARVDWTVTYTDAYRRSYVASTVDPGANPTQDDPHILKATSYTDVNGRASFTYSLTINGALLVDPLHDTITALDHYDDPILDRDYGTWTQTASKDWYDYPFKIVKHRIGDRNAVIPNVLFQIQSTGTDTPQKSLLLTGPGNVFSATTNAYGAALFYHLPCGAYDIWELVPAGYVGAGTWVKDGSFSVPGIPYYPPTHEIATQYVANTPIGEVGFYKYYLDVHSATVDLAGAGFTIRDYSTGYEYPQKLTGAAGNISWSGLAASQSPGVTWFKVTETATPAGGYTAVAPFWFYFDGLGAWNSIFYDALYGAPIWPDHKVRDGWQPGTPTGWIDLKKVTETGTEMANVTFTLKNDGGAIIKTATTNVGGIVSFLDLPASNTATTWYELEEVVPIGYTPAYNHFWFYLDKITGGQGHGFYDSKEGSLIFTGTLTNYARPTTPSGYAELNKLTYCYKPLGGAYFKVTDIVTNAFTIFGPTNDLNLGYLKLGNVFASQYLTGNTWFKVEETTVPTSYLAVNPFYFALDQTGAWVNNKFYTTPTIAGAEIWPLAAHPYLPVGEHHWVVDQYAEPPFLTSLALIPPSGTYDYPLMATVTIDVKATDNLGNPMTGQTVSMTTDVGVINVINPTTGLDGLAHFSITVSSSGTSHVQATSGPRFIFGAYLWNYNPPEPLAITSLTISPTDNVSQWAPLIIDAVGNKSGTWSVKIFTSTGTDVTSYGALSGVGSGTTLHATWTPLHGYGLVATGYYAEVTLVSGVEPPAVRNSDPFNVYNYPVKILSVELVDSSLNPIDHPTSGVPFIVKVTVKNISPISIALAGIPISLNLHFLGALATSLAPGQEITVYVPCSGVTSSGSGMVYVRDGSLLFGSPLALPFPFPVTLP